MKTPDKIPEITLNIGRDFSPDPAGRFRTDGSGSGEAFREDWLRPALNRLPVNGRIKIILDDGVEGYGSSFLVEGFAGMVKYGYVTSSDLLSVIDITYTNPDFEFYKNKIIEYIRQAKYRSSTYSESLPIGHKVQHKPK